MVVILAFSGTFSVRTFQNGVDEVCGIGNLKNIEPLLTFNSLSADPTKWSNTQTIHRLLADELFKCV